MSAEPGQLPGNSEDPEQAFLEAASAQPTQWGDRGRPAVQSVKSVQARLSRVLVGVVLGGLTAGALVWYYARAWNQPIERRAHARAVSQTKARGEMSLPPLGSLEPFRHALRTHRVSDAPASGLGTGLSEPALPGLGTASSPTAGRLDVPLQPAPVRAGIAPGAASRPRARRVSAEERRLGGHVFSAAGCTGACPENGSSPDNAGAAGPRPVMGSAVAASLSTEMPSAGHAGLWMPKGWVLECTLETAIDSALPGLTTCVMPVDVFGADGQVVLLPRGTQLVGETRGTVHQGQARIAVLWSEARTPGGVVVGLASAGTDALGERGCRGR